MNNKKCPPLGSHRRQHPAPHQIGRPLGHFRDETYSRHVTIEQRRYIDIASLAHDVPDVGIVSVFWPDRTSFQAERRPRRGCFFVCASGLRSRLLFENGGKWSCRVCAGLRYPSQTISSRLRRLASSFKKYFPERTLASSQERIIAARCHTLGVGFLDADER